MQTTLQRRPDAVHPTECKHTILGYLEQGHRDHVDKVQLHTKKAFSNADMERIRKHARKAWWDPVGPKSPDGRLLLKRPHRLTITQPKDDLYHILRNHAPTLGELSREFIVPDGLISARLVDFADFHFVQRWHNGHVQHYEEHGTYSSYERRRGMWFLNYARMSKFEPNAHCFKMEAKVAGAPTLRALGIHTMHDLATFDHAAFWQTNMLFCDIDYARFGRWHENKRLGQNRRVEHASDSRIGTTLFRNIAAPIEFTKFANQFCGGHGKSRWVVDPDETAVSWDIEHGRIPPRFTMQTLVDRYGLNMPFIRRLGPINTQSVLTRPNEPIDIGTSEANGIARAFAELNGQLTSIPDDHEDSGHAQT